MSEDREVLWKVPGSLQNPAEGLDEEKMVFPHLDGWRGPPPWLGWRPHCSPGKLQELGEGQHGLYGLGLVPFLPHHVSMPTCVCWDKSSSFQPTDKVYGRRCGTDSLMVLTNKADGSGCRVAMCSSLAMLLSHSKQHPLLSSCRSHGTAFVLPCFLCVSPSERRQTHERWT